MESDNALVGANTALAALQVWPRGYRDASTLERALPRPPAIIENFCFRAMEIEFLGFSYRPTRVRFRAVLEGGACVYITRFGAKGALQAQWEQDREKPPGVWHGRLEWYGEQAQLRDPVRVEESELGTIIPVYPGQTQPPDTEALEAAAAWVASACQPGKSGAEALQNRVLAALTAVHAPKTLPECERARTWLRRLAAHHQAAGALAAAKAWHGVVPGRVLAGQVTAPPPAGITLTASQKQAVQEILAELASGHRMHRVLSGDVATGKTVVFGAVAAACAAAGWRVAVLCPSRVIVEQTAAALATFFHDTYIEARTTAFAGEEGAGVYVGTTALLWGPGADLVIVDEQQRFSALQRETLADGGHLLEATATLIPRSHALVEAGLVSVSVLDAPPSKRDVTTSVADRTSRTSVLSALRGLLDRDPSAQVLAVYPERDEKPGAERRAAESAAKTWAAFDWLAAGEVSLLHAGHNDQEIAATMKRMREGESRVLVSTVITETGVDLPGLRAVLVSEAERFGLAQLHQIRGRVARRGGEGYCILVPGANANEEALARLRAFAETASGEEVAALDRATRGMGDIGTLAAIQHGTADSLIPAAGATEADVLNALAERASR